MSVQVLTQGYGVQPEGWKVSEKEGAGYCRVYYVTGGRVVYTAGEERCPLQTGHLYVFPSQTPFDMRQDPHDPLCCLWFHFDFFPSGLDHLVDLPVSEPIFHLLMALIGEYRLNQGSTPLFHALTQALYGYIRECGALSEPDPKQQEMLELVRRHYKEPSLAISSLSAEAGCSTEHFIRTFKACVHMAPYQYVVRLRMADAARLLLEGRRAGEVAQLLGYTNPKIFARAFIQHYGLTPTQYRRQYQPIA